MRYLTASVLLAAGIYLFYIAYTWRLHKRPIYDESVLGYSRTSVPTEFLGDIEALWPDTPHASRGVRHGPTIYLDNYREGWLDCMDAFCRKLPRLHVFAGEDANAPSWNTFENQYGIGPWHVGAPDPIIAARRDGWTKCAAQIKAKLGNESESDLRNRIIVSQMPIIVTLYVAAAGLAGLAVIVTLKRRFQKSET